MYLTRISPQCHQWKTRRKSAKGGTNSVGAGLDFPVVEDSCREEDVKQAGVEFAVFYGKLQDFQRALNGDGFFVWAVSGGQRVKNIGDGHHPCLHRNFRRG